MSISGTLSSALSGLTANARAAEIVSSNIANAKTEGYGRREIVLQSRQVGDVGQGVSVVGVYRHADPVLIGDRRLAGATAVHDQTRANFLQRVERIVGTPENGGSLSGRIAAFDTALIEASSRPESEPRLARVIDTAVALAAELGTISQDIQAARTTADDGIEKNVNELNAALIRIEDLNVLVRKNAGSGRDSSALLDQRQQLVDRVAQIIPVREIPLENGRIALITAGGTTLVGNSTAQFAYSAADQINFNLTLGNGGLSGLTLNGKPIATAGEDSPIAGGALAAHFAVRDELAPGAQAQIDAVAREVIDRFAAVGLDGSRAPGSAGLFTDAGAAFDPLNETGLSQRLRLNAAVDPNAGGEVWRLRDGLGAAAPGAVGNTQLLLDWQTALTKVQNPASATLTIGARSLAKVASDMASGIAGGRLAAESEASYSQARADSLLKIELSGGVDTDQELQSLLVIEQNYAANAKVVRAVDEMIKLLLGI